MEIGSKDGEDEVIFKDERGDFTWDDASNDDVILFLAQIHDDLSFEGKSDEEINEAVRAALETWRRSMLH